MKRKAEEELGVMQKEITKMTFFFSPPSFFLHIYVSLNSVFVSHWELTKLPLKLGT